MFRYINAIFRTRPEVIDRLIPAMTDEPIRWSPDTQVWFMEFRYPESEITLKAPAEIIEAALTSPRLLSACRIS